MRVLSLIAPSLSLTLSVLLVGCGGASADPERTTPAGTGAQSGATDPDAPASSDTTSADTSTESAQDGDTSEFCDDAGDCTALGALTSDLVGGSFGFGGLGTGSGGGSLSADAAAPQPSVTIRPRELVVRGLEEEVVRRVLRRHLNEVRFCYDQSAAQQPDAEATIRVEFVVSAQGFVTDATATGGAAESARLRDCLAGVARRWTFPAPAGAGDAHVAITYQFVRGPAAPSGPSAALGPALLQRCVPAEVTSGPTTPVALELDPPVGGCWLAHGYGAPPYPRPATEVLAVADEAALGALMSCPPGGRAQAAPDTSYFTLSDVHNSADTWEVAFVVDDGQRVHAGLRLRRACQGVAPREVLATTLMALPGAGRALTVHRCEPDPTPCPPVP